MIADVARRVLYAAVLLMMVGTFWVSVWSNDLRTQVRRGWWPPIKPLPAGIMAPARATPMPG